MMQSPIFILGSHKSGTSLLRSIFDGHSNLFVVPVESHFFQLIEFWVTYAFSKKIIPRNLSTADFISNAIGAIAYFNKEDNPLGDGISKDHFNQQIFKESIQFYLRDITLPQQSAAQCFQAYMKAIYKSLYQSELPPEKRIVEKSVENVEFALDLYQMFPDAKFIQIIRNPYVNLESMRKFRIHNRNRKNYPWLGRDFRSLHQAFYFLNRNKRLIPGYQVIRYEDLVSAPEQKLKEVCEYLEIDFQDSMLSPTYFGSSWSGNSTTSSSFSGISSKNLTKSKEIKDPLIIYLINKYLLHVLDEFNYEFLSSSKSVLWPESRENLKEYVGNRLLLATG